MPDGWYQAFSSPSREGVPSDDEIEISGCIVCSALDVEVVFPHRHVEGRRVAAPGMFGLVTGWPDLPIRSSGRRPLYDTSGRPHETVSFPAICSC